MSYILMSEEDELRFQEILKRIKAEEKVEEMKQYMQHGIITTYEHCERVARMCYCWNKRHGEKVDMDKLVCAAFLHDFYLYDWHEKNWRNKIHGFTHAKKAAMNARHWFNLSDFEISMIESHMWPLNIHKLPMSRGAWILCLSDKYVATEETFLMRKKVQARVR